MPMWRRKSSPQQRPPDKVVHKWKVFRAICVARPRLGVSERALSVLNALLSFYPETTLSGDDLIVFPSNEQLSLRAHGMPASTLRRHLAGLVDAGLVLRRDSPNGKRYARKGRGGELQFAFGFDLSPLVARAEEFEGLAAEIEAEARAVKLARERITLCRRDIAKMIADGDRRGRSDAQGRAGAGKLAGRPHSLPGGCGGPSQGRDAPATRGGCRNVIPTCRRYPHPSGNAGQNDKYERQ